MSKKLQPVAPKSTQSSFGSALYDPKYNGYIYQNDQAGPLRDLEVQSYDMLGQGYDALQGNPNDIMAQYRQMYLNNMLPQFDQQVNQTMGNYMGRLGSRFQGSLGQAGAAGQAANFGAQRAQIGQQAFDAGTDYYTQRLGQLGQVQNIATNQGIMRRAPDLATAQLQGTGAAPMQQAANEEYATKSGIYNNSQTAKSGILGSSLGTFGNAARAYLTPTPAQVLPTKRGP